MGHLHQNDPEGQNVYGPSLATVEDIVIEPCQSGHKHQACHLHRIMSVHLVQITRTGDLDRRAPQRVQQLH